MLIDVAKLDQALDRTLEAAIDHSLWPSILQSIGEATKAFGVNVLALKGIFPGGIIATESLGPALDGYFDGGWHLNEWRVRGIPLLKRQGTALEQHYTTRDDFEKQAYYRDQRRFGLGRTCVVGFSAQDNTMVMGLHRRYNDDPYDVEDEAIFRIMRERLVVSANMMHTLAVTKLDGMSEAFEATKTPAVFFARSGRITKTNQSATHLFGTDLKIVDGRLVTSSHEVTARIQKRMHAVATAVWLTPEEARPIMVVRAEKRPLLIRVQRLGGNLVDLFGASAGVCLIEDLEPAKVSDISTVARSFGLTIKQAEIALLLAQGKRLREIADMVGITYETARTHLRAIFEKTSTNCQSELVALLTRNWKTL